MEFCRDELSPELGLVQKSSIFKCFCYSDLHCTGLNGRHLDFNHGSGFRMFAKKPYWNSTNGLKQTTVLYYFGTNTKTPSIGMFPVLGIWIPTVFRVTVFRCLLFKFPLYIVFVKFAWTLRTMTCEFQLLTFSEQKEELRRKADSIHELRKELEDAHSFIKSLKKKGWTNWNF